MPNLILKKVDLLEDRALRPGGRKLCDPLKEWRDDAPESFPFCIACGLTIQIGMRYVVGWPNDVFCTAHGNPDGKLR